MYNEFKKIADRSLIYQKLQDCKIVASLNYQKLQDCKIVAISQKRSERLASQLSIN